jgi:hypothetical protein
MLARYANAQTLTGSYVWIQSAGSVSIKQSTQIQFERPGKLYLLQTRDKPQPGQRLVISDGKLFVYDVPAGLSVGDKNKDERLAEHMDVYGKVMTIKDVYNAASSSIFDRSVPLDVAISRLEDLRFDRDQWITLSDAGMADVAGQQGHKITGPWRPIGYVLDNQGNPTPERPAGAFSMVIDDDGDLLYYSVTQTVTLRASDGHVMPPQEVTTAYEVHFTVGGKPDPSLFTVK